jgi:hypothetical protein
MVTPCASETSEMNTPFCIAPVIVASKLIVELSCAYPMPMKAVEKESTMPINIFNIFIRASFFFDD